MIVIENYDGMKREVAEMCSFLQDIPESILFNVKLIAYELLSNVFQHGGGRAFFSYVKKGGELRMSVKSENKFCPPEKSTCAATDAECGRGLFLVDTLSLRREYSDGEGISVIIAIKE